MSTASARPRTISFARLISTCISVRLLTDTAAQMFNPFLPIFAAGLGIDVVVMGRLVALRSSMGLFAPYFGSLADRLGYRRVMSTALLVGAAGMFILGTSNSVLQTALGMILLGLGMAAFVPTLQAYLGARLPYAQLARGMGMMEYSWALTGIVGLSLLGLLIAATSWRAPFFALGIGLIIAFFIFRTLPSVREDNPPPRPIDSDTRPFWQRMRAFFHVGNNAASTYAAIAASGFIFLGFMQVMAVHGIWYADQFGFGPRELGTVALVFGCFDLVASISVSLFTDRFGKRRSVILGTTGALVFYLLIPWLNFAALPAIVSTAFSRGFFEFAIVANLPLLSGQSPNQRAKVMTLSAATTLTCSTIASFIAPSLYTQIGITGIMFIAATSTGIAILLLATRVREPQTNTMPAEITS